MTDWRPGANHAIQRQRAALLADLRGYFAHHHVMEVETPLLCRTGVTDPALENFEVPCGKATRFLQTSPEYAMKRLLAAGSGDIFQICKAFRQEEQGVRHNPEYTLLEWYRLDIDHYQLAREVGELVAAVLERPGWQVWSWQGVFQEVLGVGAHCASREDLEELALGKLGEIPLGLDRDGLLDLLMSHCVEPGISDWGIVFIVDYPPSQAALARQVLDAAGELHGARFECYVDGTEVANGYWECSDASELRARFAADNRLRRARGQPERIADEYLLEALTAGLPPCAGVALGVDRLLALKTGAQDLDAILSFGWSRS
ncbi:MAG: EF-P lysine aminoacylase EpmA [Luminiphilus sp.]|nr:EF-P lysine aminoacylase EpmA [Luminiphilus sp.]